MTLDPEVITASFITQLLKVRAADSHKGTYGHAYLLAGSKGKMGAAVLAARACLRTGAGLLTVNTPMPERAILQTSIPEAMLADRNQVLNLDIYSAIGAGPAMGTTAASFKLLLALLKSTSSALVLDADALNLLSLHPKAWKYVPPYTIITPHPKEFDRLFGRCDHHEERMSKAILLSEKFSWIIILKNYQTLIAANGKGYLNVNGNAGLAKGGSGDILTGIITGLLAQHYEPLHAALIGVFIHGLSADIAIKNQSVESLLASDVIEFIGSAYTQLHKG